MNKIVLLMGPPKAGKTTARREIEIEAERRGFTYASISKNDIREEICGDRSDQSWNALIVVEEHCRIRQHLLDNDVNILIVDDCNQDKARRNPIIQMAKYYQPSCEIVIVHLTAPINLLFFRNKEVPEDERVPENVISGINEATKMPRKMSEAFDKYIRISPEEYPFDPACIFEPEKNGFRKSTSRKMRIPLGVL